MKNTNLGLLSGLVHLNGVIYILMIVFNALGGIGYEGIVKVYHVTDVNESINQNNYVLPYINQRYF